ncbi:hypothetical protein O3P69_017924 [Scylla paramamosain]|uniref:Uncharacterized protein n=1 Tax=Scylla paramamosain TaxID=85552 RepID=A0AAW0THJ6_SCYPA
METKMKILGDPYVTENQKNSSQEKEQILDRDEARGIWSVLRRNKVLVGAVVLLLVLASVGAGVSLASSSFILHHLGFTSKGLTKKANNHTVPQDSWVSWLQKAGQKGLTTEHQAYFATGGAIVGVAAAAAVVMVAVVVSRVLRRCRQ